MRKYLALATVLLGSISIADAAKLKIKEFFPMNGASASADGMAFFVEDEVAGCVDIKIHVSDLAPNSSYGVMCDGGVFFDTPAIAGIHTNPSGNGHLSITCLAGQTLSIPVIVTVYRDVDCSGFYDVGEERLMGDSAP